MKPDQPDGLAPAFFEKMVESVGVGVGIYGDDGRYLYVNDAYADLFDATPSELVGTPLWEVVPDIDADRFDGYLDAFEEGVTKEAETIHRFHGQEVPVQTITTRWTIDGVAYHFGTIKDITERRAREREIRRQNERLENFASIVSHDLRNPLTVAKGYIDHLQEDIDRDELRLADNALDRMDTLVGELLDLARSNESAGDTERVSLGDTARDAWDVVPTGDASLHTPLSDVTLEANESRLRQLFENLFRNAIEHGGDVEITLGTLADGFFVADDGPGIPSEAREHVFEPGYTTTETGTGFGLNIVQQIVSGHDWTIAVTGGADGGARFEITGTDSIE